MPTIAFTVTEKCAPHAALTRIANPQVNAAAWQQLADHVAHERTLLPYPPQVLAARWEHGYAAIALAEGAIVSYVSLAPLLTAAHRRQFGAQLGVDPARLPAIAVYEFTTGWTHPEWRRYGISAQLRPPLLQTTLLQTEGQPGLGISGMAGLASPVVAKLGWQIIGWSKIPYTHSLIAAPSADFPERARHGWRPPTGLLCYEGPHIPLDNTTHPWNQYIYCWVSDTALALDFNAQMAALLSELQCDLHRWREVILDVYGAPDSGHRVAFIE